ncbi:heme exporter protein CcmB [Salmonella enterica]|uniref:heme exporter protein CcmB n=2 Tax=Salmonella enterica TaxID=28901 RepID=UPI0021C2EAE9|nr:heme exporter protein CcmB [Salmonella enterica]
MMWRVFCLELRVAFRHGADIAGPLWFFLMVITLFPLSVGPQPQLLARIAPGIIQVAALLASLLALERLFRDDLQDGSLEQLMLLPVPLPAVVRGGVLLGILVLPLSVPVLIFATAAMDAASMHLPVDGYLAVLGALLAGSATLSPFATAAALRISTQ